MEEQSESSEVTVTTTNNSSRLLFLATLLLDEVELRTELTTGLCVAASHRRHYLRFPARRAAPPHLHPPVGCSQRRSCQTPTEGTNWTVCIVEGQRAAAHPGS